jgi:hypothetical protein
MTIMTDMEALGAIARGENVPQLDVMRLWREGPRRTGGCDASRFITPSYRPTGRRVTSAVKREN